MRKYLLLAAITASLPIAALGQLPTYEPKYGASGLDLGAMDTSISPCSNFYQYSCGLWRAKNPVPPDRARWAQFNQLSDKNLSIEREILEKAAQPSPSGQR